MNRTAPELIRYAADDHSVAVARFLGRDARITDIIHISVSKQVSVERMDVQLATEEPADDTGMLYLYPIGGNRYCMQLCYLQTGDTADDPLRLFSIRYLPDFFDQFPAEVLNAGRPFRFDETTEQQFSVCSKTRALLQQVEQELTAPPLIRSLQYTESAIQLLRRALECITIPFVSCQVPACRFLAYESERDKITEAMRILEENIDQPQTIKDLSRKVAMNECYLKKGFKAMTGKTIHEYQQSLRINEAKKLLQQEGRSVTDVANILGYSSISHFSTAFKKLTGMKPCELLA